MIECMHTTSPGPWPLTHPPPMVDLEQESRFMATLHHPNVVTFYGVCLDLENLMMVTELCDGGDLTHYLDRAIFTLSMAMNLGKDIASGMHYLHQV